MSYGDVQAAWSHEIWAALEAAGVGHVVVSPGSRSTPLTLAAALTALELHVVVDERAAGFFALGIARLRREPVALLCSSGTAGAHYLPAIIEAAEAGHPLIVLTADRPPELHHLGASQTTDQRAFFGRHSVFSAVLGMPSDNADRRAAARAVVARAAALACSHRGPVHLDVPMRKPFEPTVDSTRSASTLDVFSTDRVLSNDSVAMLAARVDHAATGWVVAGPCALDDDDAEAVRAFCARSGFALLAEPSSNLRTGVATTAAGKSFLRADGFDLALRDEATHPELVLQLGRSPVSKVLHDVLDGARGSFDHVVIADHGWHDAARTATAMVRAPIGATLRALAEQIQQRPPAETTETFVERCDAAWHGVLAALLDGGDRASEPGALRTVVANLPDGGTLFVGNSQPIRDLSEFCVSLPENVGVVTQRGVAGIDGNIAAALGMGAVARVPISAVIGDIAFFHDAGALLEHRTAKGPVVLIVLNNDGGRIFDALPIASSPAVASDLFQRLWITPRSASIVAVAEAYGARAASTDSLAELAALMTEAYEIDGVSVIEVRVDPSFSRMIRESARLRSRPVAGD